MTYEAALEAALENEKARAQTMKIIEKIRKIPGATQTLLVLAGYILTATPTERGEAPAA